MNDLKKFGKKLFSMSVSTMTIFWSIGLSAFVPAGAAVAACAELEAGDLFKVKGSSAVYLVDADMKRRYFPNSEVYNSWFKDFSGVVTIDPVCSDAYPSGGGVNFRPGSRLVKTVISPSVFAVGPDNMKHKLADEAVAKALYGASWSKLVRDLPDVFDSNYKVGAELKEAKLHDGMLVKKTGETSVYYVWMGKLMKVDGTLGTQSKNDVRTVSADVFGTATMDTGTVTPATVVENPSQLAKAGTPPAGTPPAGTPPAGTTPPAAGTGKLKISVAGDTPSGTYAIKNAARVVFTKLVFENTGDASVTVESFKVVRGGTPAVNGDFGAVNVLDPDGNLLNDAGKTLNSDNQVTFTEDIVVAKGEKKVYSLVGDMAATVGAGNQPNLGLHSVVTTATVDATLPLAGNSVVTNNNVTLGTVTLAEGPQIGNITKQVGTNDLNVATLKVTVATNDFQVSRIVFYNSSSTADEDIQNFELKFNNKVISTGKMKNKYLTFDLKDCTADCKIEKGNDRTYSLFADVVSGSGRVLNLDIQRAVHVVAKDLKEGFYVTPTFGSSSAASMTNSITISQGKLDVSKTSDVPTADVPRNASNVELASWNFKVTGEPVDVRTIAFQLTTTGGANGSSTQYTSLILYDKKSGKALIGGVDAANTSGAIGYATSTDTFTLQMGDNILVLKGKISNNPAAGDTIQAAVDMRNTTNIDARGVNSGETITLGSYATPQSTVAANVMTVKTAALRVTTMATPPSTTYAAGTTDITIAKVQMDAAGSSEDLKCTQFKIQDATDGTAKTIDIQNIRLFVDKDGDSFDSAGSDTQLVESQNGSDSTAGNNETFTFNLSGDDQFLIKKGKKVVVSLKASIAGGAAVGTHNFKSNAANDVTCVGQTSNSEVSETVDTASGTGVTVGNAGGTIEVSVDSSNPPARNFAAGTQGVTLATFKFYATTSEDVWVDTINFTQRVTDTNSSAYQDYTLLYLVDEAGKTVGSVQPTTTATFIDLLDDAANRFVVKSSDTDGALLHLKANLTSIGQGQTVTVGGHNLGFNISAGGHVFAKGATTGSESQEYLSTASAPNGNTHYMYKGAPTVVLCTAAADDLANNKCKAVGGVLTNGSNELFRFAVKAGTANVGLYKFTFDFATTTANVTSVELLDVTETSEVQLFTSTTLGTAANMQLDMVFDTDSSGVAAGGEERTVSISKPRLFLIRGTATGVASGASISTRIGGDAAYPISPANLPGTVLMWSASSTDTIGLHEDFIWSDLSAGSHATSTNDWTTGFLVDGLPSASSTPQVVAK